VLLLPKASEFVSGVVSLPLRLYACIALFLSLSLSLSLMRVAKRKLKAPKLRLNLGNMRGSSCVHARNSTPCRRHTALLALLHLLLQRDHFCFEPLYFLLHHLMLARARTLFLCVRLLLRLPRARHLLVCAGTGESVCVFDFSL